MKRERATPHGSENGFQGKVWRQTLPITPIAWIIPAARIWMAMLRRLLRIP